MGQDFLGEASALAFRMFCSVQIYNEEVSATGEEVKPIGLAMGVPTLKEVFNEKYYTDLPGGILTSFGRLFEKDLKAYVYPQRDAKIGALVGAANLLVSPHLRHIYSYLCENRFIEAIRGYRDEYLPFYACVCSQKSKRVTLPGG